MIGTVHVNFVVGVKEIRLSIRRPYWLGFTLPDGSLHCVRERFPLIRMMVPSQFASVMRESYTVSGEVCTLHQGTHAAQGVLCCSERGLCCSFQIVSGCGVFIMSTGGSHCLCELHHT